MRRRSSSIDLSSLGAFSPRRVTSQFNPDSVEVVEEGSSFFLFIHLACLSSLSSLIYSSAGANPEFLRHASRSLSMRWNPQGASHETKKKVVRKQKKQKTTNSLFEVRSFISWDVSPQ